MEICLLHGINHNSSFLQVVEIAVDKKVFGEMTCWHNGKTIEIGLEQAPSLFAIQMEICHLHGINHNSSFLQAVKTAVDKKVFGEMTRWHNGKTIEIGLEQAPFVVFVYFFPHLNM